MSNILSLEKASLHCNAMESKLVSAIFKATETLGGAPVIL